MLPANVVFMGNLLYPDGLADTKRVQYFIDGVGATDGTAAVLLLRQNHPGRRMDRLRGEHRRVRYETIGEDLRGGPGVLLGLARYWRNGLRFLRQQRRTGALNVLFVYGEPNIENIMFVLGGRLMGYRVMLDIVEDSYALHPNAPLLSRLKARSAAWANAHVDWFADGVIVISTYLQDKLEAVVGGRRPIQLIPVAVDLSRVPPVSAGFHSPVRVLYAGSFGDKDGVENLIDAVERVRARGGDIELRMTGRGSDLRMAAVRQRVDASPARAHIDYLGFLPEAEYFRVLAETDIACVVRVRSDFAERGFPFKLGEYLATGRPVIAARTGDVPRYLTDRTSAMLVEPGSVDDIAAALEYLLADEDRARAIGAAGRRVAEAHFSARSAGERFVDLVTRVGAG